MAKNKLTPKLPAPRWLFLGSLPVGMLLILGVWWVRSSQASQPAEAPEAQKVLEVQAGLPFQILIPAYLPRAFDRPNMEINVSQSGPGGEPMVQLTYRTKMGEKLFIREWVPVNPDKEILASSRPVETKWGKGWFLKQGDGLIATWVDIGPLRASIFTTFQQMVSKEELLVVAETMGPASNSQAFSFVLDPPELRAVEPPPPVEIPVNDQGIQEVDLIVTPGGYDPLRFSVKVGVPVRLTFRQMGRVGCGNELNFPTGPNNTLSLKLDSPSDKKVVEFTPQSAGVFQFFCAHLMYRGVMTVRE